MPARRAQYGCYDGRRGRLDGARVGQVGGLGLLNGRNELRVDHHDHESQRQTCHDGLPTNFTVASSVAADSLFANARAGL